MNGAENCQQHSGTEHPSLTGKARQTAEHTNKPRPVRCTLFALVLAVFFSMGHFAGAYQKEKELEQLRAKTIISEKFEIRDVNNKLRASLSQEPNGEVQLMFIDGAGHLRLALGLGRKGNPEIDLFDADSAQKMSISLDPQDGTSAVVLFDGKTRPAIRMGIVKGFGPDLTIGRDGESQITAFLTQDGEPSVQLLDSKRNPLLALGVTGNEPSVSLLGPGGANRALWRVLPDASVELALFDSQVKRRLVVATDKAGHPSIRFLNPDNTIAKEFK